MKKKSPTKIIEEDKNKEYEIGFARSPGQEFIPAYSEALLSPISVKFKKSLLPKSDKYTTIHTHPIREQNLGVTTKKRETIPGFEDLYKTDVDTLFSSFPSIRDIHCLLDRKNEKTCIVAQRDIGTGKIGGYFFLRKTKKTPEDFPTFHERHEFPNDLKGYKQYKEQDELYENHPLIREITLLEKDFEDKQEALFRNPEERKSYNITTFMNTLQKYGIQFRAVPNSGYEYIPGAGFLPTQQRTLEQKAFATASVIGIISGIFFLSNFSKSFQLSPEIFSSNSVNFNFWLGIILILIGIFAGIFWYKKRK